MKYQGFDTKDMDAADAVEMLERLASCEDPIMYKGRDTTPRGLFGEEDLDGKAYRLEPIARAQHVRVKFYGAAGWINSTLKMMVEDRIRLHRAKTPQDKFHGMTNHELKEACEHKVFQMLGSVRCSKRAGLVAFAAVLGVETTDE